MDRMKRIGVACVALSALWLGQADAGFLDKLMDQVQQTTEDRARRKVDEAIDRSLEKAEDKVKGAPNEEPKGPTEEHAGR